MYSILHEILADKKGGRVFACFGGWHFAYILAAALAAALLLWILRKKPEGTRQKTVRALIHIAFGLYVADLFLMPLAFGEIDIVKLPFHVCTAMCVMCFLSQHHGRLRKLRVSFALLGFVSNLIYLIYPAGVMWHQVGPLSYRVVQTLLFHGIMTVYGLLVLVYEGKSLSFRKCYRELPVIAGMTLWAMLGNFVYNGTSEGYDHFFNWFFVVRDPFYLLSENVAPYVMPVLNMALFFAVEMLIYFVISLAQRRQKRSMGSA